MNRDIGMSIIKTSCVVISAVLIASCSADITRLDLPFFGTEEQEVAFDNDPRPTGSIAPIPAIPVPNGSPSSTNLRQVAVSSAYPDEVPTTTEITAQPLPSPVAQQPAITGYGYRSLGGGFSEVNISPNDNLQEISKRYGISERKILEANKLSSAAEINGKRRLIIPPYNYRAGDPVPSGDAVAQLPINGAPQGGSTAAAPANIPPNHTTHMVAPGDTLSSISRRYGVSVGQLIAANQLQSPNHIEIGQRIALGNSEIGSSGTDRRPIIAPPPPVRVASLGAQAIAQRDNSTGADVSAGLTQPPVPTPRTDLSAVRSITPTLRPAPPAGKRTKVASLQPQSGNAGSDRPLARRKLPQPKAMTSEKFRWPARGRVISAFGTKSGGTHNDGINIAVPLGTSIKAAENGVVAYAGNELQGFGNLILIRHDKDWVTAYAHASKILVKRGDMVQRGQIIAKAGQSGPVTSPQLHFEVRKGSRPVNPIPYMSSNH